MDSAADNGGSPDPAAAVACGHEFVWHPELMDSKCRVCGELGSTKLNSGMGYILYPNAGRVDHGKPGPPTMAAMLAKHGSQRRLFEAYWSSQLTAEEEKVIEESVPLAERAAMKPR